MSNNQPYIDNQSYISTGNDSINLHTGKLNLKFDITSIASPTFPFTLSYCYNKDSFTSSKYGRGWSISAAQHIEYEDQLIYYDAMGQEHYFFSGKDTGGLGLKIETQYEINEISGYTLTDKSDSVMTFDADGKLLSVFDVHGNGVTLQYSGEKLLSIRDTHNRTLTLNYTSSTALCSVTDNAGRATAFTYESGPLLNTITYPDNTQVLFTYDTYDRVTSITHPDGTKTAYTYLSGFQDAVKRISKYPANSNVCEEFIDITIRDNRTTVKDRTGIDKIYAFDAFGRPTFVYEEKKNANGEIIRSPITSSTSYSYTDKRCSFKGAVIDTNEQNNFLNDGNFNDEIIEWDSGWDETEDRPTHQWLQLEDCLEQTVPASEIQLTFGDTLMFSSWIKVNSTSSSDNEKIKLCVDVIYGKQELIDAENNEYDVIEETTIDTFSAEFDKSSRDWQYLTVPARIDTTRTFHSVRAYINHSDNSNTYEIDNARLVNALAVSSITEKEDPNYRHNFDYVNDEVSGDVPPLEPYNITVFGEIQKICEKTTTHDGIFTTVSEVNEFNNTVRKTVTDLDGNSFISYFAYNDKHKLIRSQNYRGVMTEHSYNSVGMPTVSKTYYCASMNPDVTAAAFVVPAKAFMTEVTYDSTGEFAISTSDERDENIKELSNYDVTKGLLNYSVDPNGNRTDYTYDADNDLITKISMPASGGGEFSVVYGYDKRRLTKITHNGFDYDFTFDAMGRAHKTIIAGTEYATNSYTLAQTTTVETTYASGEKMTVETDRHQNPIKRTYTDALGNQSVVATAEYDEMRRLKKSIDNTTNKCYTYTYDEVSNVTEEYIDGVLFKDYEYDNDNRLVKTTVNAGGATQAYLPIYDKTSDGKIYCDNAVVGVELEGVFTHKAEHDEYGRTTEKNLTLANGATPLLSDEYTYLGSATRLTHMVASVTQKLNGVTQGTFSYTYDNNGNITEIRKNNSLIAKYTYDEMNQLVREDNYLLNKTYIFAYDTAGNILSKNTYNTVLATESGTPDATTAYTYATSGWKDQLVNVGGEAIVYDVLGNPTTYRGHNLTWGKLRQLNSFDSNTFTYNSEGIRTSKNSITYTLDGTKILAETRPAGTIKYLYGASGVIGFTYNNNTYYYEKNIQGDVTAIVNASGTIKAKYTYDAWGNHTITLNTDGIGTLNPIRYRSYYFDTETGLYYLQSRYYDPEIGKWINTDSQINISLGILGTNQFSYCLNNPINKIDYNGNKPGDLFDTMDEAARDFGLYINEQSIKDNKEYSSYIYEVEIKIPVQYTIPLSRIFPNIPLPKGATITIYGYVTQTKYAYTEPHKGAEQNVILPVIGYAFVKKVALLHTHGGYMYELGNGNDYFSTTDKWVADIYSVPFYVVTPRGTLRKYDPSTQKDILLFTDLPYDPVHPKKKGAPYGQTN